MKMAIIWLIAKIVIFAVILNILFRQTYNLIFFRWRKPAVWIGASALLGVAGALFAFGLSLKTSDVSFAVTFVVLLNLKAPAPKGVTRVEVDTGYAEMGIEHGRLKYFLGLVTFAFLLAASYVLPIAESCAAEGKCTPLLRTILP
jgi:hypothetical protein